MFNLNSNSKLYYYTKITWKYHLIFWLIYFTINTLRWGSYYGDYLYSLRSNLLGFPIHLTLSYLNVYVLMPFLVFRKKYLIYIIVLLSAIFVMVSIKFNLTYYLLNTNVWPEGPEVTSTLTVDYVVDMMIGELYVITFVTAIKITADWLKEHKRLTDLEKLQMETELLFLKTQVSPHFFFNTLNNIYSLSIEKSDKTPKIILKLSELMRYLLYETKRKRQSLSKEIICLQNYLELEKIRHGEDLVVNMDISGDISGKRIAPILLLSFVENAFKHGANKNIGKVNINIDFNIKEDFLYFTITNPTPADSEYEQRLNTTGGIGLKNVKKRLALGYKKDQYDLNIENGQNLFTVKLKIKV
ncbi:sensor histidine kinase [Aureibaculum sp. A20]|uniref:Sensor histidine kinase n=2 Tax=Aureibaculum flavum TaxID=2795986 RepID=A0ABS0WLI6_9FLAO|nr:sensor histidine kinase [Aureibaculum flavum]